MPHSPQAQAWVFILLLATLVEVEIGILLPG